MRQLYKRIVISNSVTHKNVLSYLKLKLNYITSLRKFTNIVLQITKLSRQLCDVHCYVKEQDYFQAGENYYSS